MNALAGPFLVAAVLLGLAAAAKLRNPAATGNALRAVGLPGSPVLVRAGAAVELAVAIGAVALGNRVLVALVAASYVGFAVFVVAALRRRVPLSSCGCFGRSDTPPSVIHVVLNFALAVPAGAVAFGAAGAGAGGLGRILDGQPLLGIPFLALTATAVALAYVSMTLLPTALAPTAPADAGRSR